MKPEELLDESNSMIMTTDEKITELWMEYRRQRRARIRSIETLELLGSMIVALAAVIGIMAVVLSAGR